MVTALVHYNIITHVHSFLPLLDNKRESNSVGVHSFLPVSRLGEKSAGAHSFFPVLNNIWKSNSVGVHSFMPVSHLGEKCAGVHSSIMLENIHVEVNNNY